jgi:hypothetical protein
MPRRALLGATGSVTAPPVELVNRPTQPMRYHYDQQPLSAWAHPGALVIAGLGRSDLGPPGIDPAYEGTDPGYIAAAEAGATVIAYIDPIIDNDFGLYHELLHHETDSLGRSVGPATSLWPGGPFVANEYGNLADFRVGSVLQQKFGAVLEMMLDECPWLAGFWLDDVGTRSWYPDFSWENDFTATDRQAYRDGAIALVQTARQVCDTNRINGQRRILIVNGTWTAGTLLSDGGGYPDPEVHGCSLVEGGEIEHHELDSWWIDYATGPQWATEASTDGVPFIVASCLTDADQDAFIAADILSHSESAESATTVWGSFHETGLPDARG